MYFTSVIISGLFAFILWSIVSYLYSPLKQYPGPLIAKWTNVWRLLAVLKGDYHLTVKRLHDKHGPIVRLGPNTLDLDIPELIKALYNTDGKWRKTEFYSNNSTIVNGKINYTMFSHSDPVQHALMKRPVAKYYTPGNVLTIEPLIDSVIGLMCDHLDRRFVNGPEGPQSCNLGDWIAYCTWDMVGASTFSKCFGYMDHGCDFDHTIKIADKSLDYFAAVGQIPFLDFLLDKNPVMRIGPPNLGNVARIAIERMALRTNGTDPNFDPKIPDYMQHFLDIKSQDPDTIHDGILLNYLFINLIAGADTTALTIRAIFYFLLKNPRVYKKLVMDVQAANFETKIVSYTNARALPYLEAVVRESMRLHPGVAMLLERYVPEAGLRLPSGKFIPPGTAVGINPYVVNRNRDIWGADADEFRPERWLKQVEEDEVTYKERMRLFNATDFTFGSGSRICLGRHLALLEIYKMTATLIRRYEIEEISDMEKSWKVTCSWFLRQSGLFCKLKRY